MKLEIVIDCTSEAFGSTELDRTNELGAIITGLALQVELNRLIPDADVPILDTNGTVVGHYVLRLKGPLG